jgi:hypothetical protein
MTPSADIRQKAIALLNQLSSDRLVAVVQLLEFLAQPSQAEGNAEEVALLQVIGRQLTQDEQVRLEELRDRCEWGKLTHDEHEELIRYEDILEAQRVEHLRALIELAKLRNIDLITLNRQLQSESNPFHVA